MLLIVFAHFSLSHFCYYLVRFACILGIVLYLGHNYFKFRIDHRLRNIFTLYVFAGICCELEGNVLDRTFDNTAAIDVEAQETYLQSQGTDTSEMDETSLAQANTGSKVFIASNVKFVDAMEDLKLTCNM